MIERAQLVGGRQQTPSRLGVRCERFAVVDRRSYEVV
jgi:hypothetical protein